MFQIDASQGAVPVGTGAPGRESQFINLAAVALFHQLIVGFVVHRCISQSYNFQSKLSFIKKNTARSDALFEITTVDEKIVCSFEKLEGDGAESILYVLDEDGRNQKIPVSRIFKIKELIS